MKHSFMGKCREASDRRRDEERVETRERERGPSEHLGAKINNPIAAAVSGSPQAPDSLNYLSVVAGQGQGCPPLSVCLRASASHQ